jgi:hypothetical protein
MINVVPAQAVEPVEAPPIEIRREGQQDQHLDFRRFVHTTGAVYAFAPSIRALPQLSGELQVGAEAFVCPGGWRLREQPNLQGPILVMLGANTQVHILDGPQSADGHIWWRVRTSDGREGWVASGGLINATCLKIMPVLRLKWQGYAKDAQLA